jgi:hypothetical protein
MLAGAKVTPAAEQAAREMLEEARAARSGAAKKAKKKPRP